MQLPIERVLGRQYKRTASGKMIEARDCCYDVPLLDSLQSLLKCKSVVQQVLHTYCMYSQLAQLYQFIGTKFTSTW